jgi:hypothetical protein
LWVAVTTALFAQRISLAVVELSSSSKQRTKSVALQ